ncbi:MAG: PDZ domain-containing protein, partial [Gemmatimonadota bacterium]
MGEALVLVDALVARRIGGNQADAEDVVQDTLLEVCRSTVGWDMKEVRLRLSNRRTVMKLRRIILAALAATVAVPSAYAQDKREECDCLRSRSGRVRVFQNDDWPRGFWVGGRPRLGVRVDTRADPATDSIGARIEEVTGGGPAEKAGIQAGDIITRLNGQSLLSGDDTYDEDDSAPARRLIKRARSLDRGDTVEVEFRRGSETRTVELVAGEFDDDFVFEDLRVPVRLREQIERLGDLPNVYFRGPESVAWMLGTSLPGLELVSLNPELGEYFGTDEGVLVLSVPEDSALGLKAGDVIQTIGGRSVTSPSHSMR